MVHIDIRNESTRKRVYHAPGLRLLAGSICDGEGFKEEAELSVLFCDDPFIKDLNRTYRGKNRPTDVLSFAQRPEGAHALAPDGVTRHVLGDIVISLETVERFCTESASFAPELLRQNMRNEVRLLFCHGLLHLLGWIHNTDEQQSKMIARQAAYLGVDLMNAWHR